MSRHIITVCLSFAILVAVFFFSCVHESRDAVSTGHLNGRYDSVVNYNRHISGDEQQLIDDFILRYRWNMKQTSTGLRFMIYHHGNGTLAKEGMTVTLNYTIRLLNGNLCYSSEGEGPMEFRLGHSLAPRGLEEGILLMHSGDKAKLIVPSHLAFGLLGDQRKIPQRATLVYDIEIVKLK
jgi:FKBP-type peptidyl-prolyl cis-trans isomerase FkpA